MRLEIFRNRFKVNLDKKKVLGILQKIIDEYGKEISFVNIILMSDDKVLNINKKYLNHHDYTDIITFNYADNGEPIMGELYISVKRVRENAKKFIQTPDKELYRVVIHGLLHLMGEEDKTEKQKEKMRLLENKYLEIL